MSEVANIPQLRFSEFSGEWEEKKLGELCKFTQGVQIPFSEQLTKYKEGAIRYLYIRDFFTDDFPYYVKDQYPNKVIHTDEIMMVNTGNTAGKAFMGATGVLSNNAFKVSFDKTKVSNIFLFQRITSDTIQRRIKSFFNAGGQPHLGHKNIAIIPMGFASLKEQQKIAVFLSAVDNKIEQLSKKKALLGEYKKGLMQQIFSQAIRFKSDDGGTFPDWEEKNGNEIFDNISNKNHDSDLPILAITQEHGAIPRDLINYKMIVSDKSVSSYKVVETGDFIISLRSFQGGIEYSNYKGICSPAYIILRPAIEIEKKFYKYYLKTYRYIQDLNRKLEGIRDGKMVSYKYFSEIKLPYPSISEQAKIANFLSSIDNKIEQVGKQLRESKQFKKALLQQMFV